MKKITPMRAIRLKCLDCMAGSAREVKLCSSDDCPLFQYRFGKRPATIERQNKKEQLLPNT